MSYASSEREWIRERVGRTERFICLKEGEEYILSANHNWHGATWINVSEEDAPTIAAADDLLRALIEMQSNCSACSGSGTMSLFGGDETEIGMSPGSSNRDCTYCAKARAAIAKATPE